MSGENKVVKVFVSVFLVASVIWISGCDFLDGFFHRKAEVDAVVHQPPQPEIIPPSPAVQEPNPAKSDCATLRHYITTRLKLLKGRQSESDKEFAVLKADRKKFSERIKELSEANLSDKKGTFASGLALLLDDELINELAYKHLGSDFAVFRHEFSEKVRNVVVLEQKKREELERKRSKLEGSVAEARIQTEHARKESAANIARLRKEIEAKERRLRSLQKDAQQYSGGDQRHMQQYRETTREEIDYLKIEIPRMRSELQQEMQSPRVRDANRRAESIEKQANDDSRRLEEMAVRKGKDEVSIEQITEKYGKLTIHRLDSVLHEKNCKIQKSQKLLSEQILFLESVVSGLETLDSTGLKRVRSEVEKELSRTVEAVGK